MFDRARWQHHRVVRHSVCDVQTIAPPKPKRWWMEYIRCSFCLWPTISFLGVSSICCHYIRSLYILYDNLFVSESECFWVAVYSYMLCVVCYICATHATRSGWSIIKQWERWFKMGLSATFIPIYSCGFCSCQRGVPYIYTNDPLFLGALFRTHKALVWRWNTLAASWMAKWISRDNNNCSVIELSAAYMDDRLCALD